MMIANQLPNMSINKIYSKLMSNVLTFCSKKSPTSKVGDELRLATLDISKISDIIKSVDNRKKDG